MSKNNILKRLSPIQIVSLICVVVTVATVIASAIFYFGNEVKDAKREFDYTKETLTDYITLGEYEKLEVTPEYTKLREVDVQAEILNLLAGEKNHSSAQLASYNTATKITVGDVVNLYYRGYVVEEDGTRNYMDGMSNFGASYSKRSAYSLSIGGDSFIPGFALALEGNTVGQYPKMEVTRDVDVTENDIAFVTYTRYPMTKNQYSGVETQGTAETATAVFVDLTLGEAKIDAIYGEGFYKTIVGVKENEETEEKEQKPALKANGENTKVSSTNDLRLVNAEGVDYKYTKLVVEYTMSPDYYENYQPIEVEFPENYHSADLAGKTAYFEIMIESVKEYTIKIGEKDVELALSDTENVNAALKQALEEDDDFNEYLKGLTEEEKTASYVDLYTDYLYTEHEKNNAMNNELALYQAIIDALVDSTTVKADHPELEAKYQASLITFRSSYASEGSSYATIEEYAEAVIGGDHYVYVYEKDGKWVVYADENGNPLVPAEDDTTEYVKVYDWKAAVKQLSVDYFTERMAIHQIIKDKNLNTGDAFKNAYDKLYNEYYNEYAEYYCTSNGIDIDEMTATQKDAVDAATKSYLQSSVGYEYLTDRAYYQLVFDYLLEKEGDNYVRITINE